MCIYGCLNANLNPMYIRDRRIRRHTTLQIIRIITFSNKSNFSSCWGNCFRWISFSITYIINKKFVGIVISTCDAVLYFQQLACFWEGKHSLRSCTARSTRYKCRKGFYSNLTFSKDIAICLPLWFENQYLPAYGTAACM